MVSYRQAIFIFSPAAGVPDELPDEEDLALVERPGRSAFHPSWRPST